MRRAVGRVPLPSPAEARGALLPLMRPPTRDGPVRCHIDEQRKGGVPIRKSRDEGRLEEVPVSHAG